MQSKSLLKLFVFMLLCSASFAQPKLKHISTYFTNVFNEGAAEIVAYDKDNQQLYFTNADANSITILDFSNPSDLKEIKSIDCSTYGGGINSVAYYNGYIAAAIEGNELNEKGTVVFFDKDGNYVNHVEVGFLPDMITFSPDGNKVLVANEGEPLSDYSIDPIGSISVIDVSAGITSVSQSNVSELGFESFQDKLDAKIRIFGPLDSFNDDFEETDDSLNNYRIFSYAKMDTLFFDDLDNSDDSLKKYEIVSDASNVNWYYDSYNGNYFAEMNGFSADVASADWLILPSADLTNYEKAYFSMDNAKNFSGGTFDILISTNYDGLGNPSAATWDTLTAMANLSTGGYTIVNTGNINISKWISSSTYIAMHYTSTAPGAGGGAVYQLENFAIFGTAEYKGNSWYYDTYSSDYFAEMNNYNADGDANTWLLMPSLNLNRFTKAHFSFNNAISFTGGTFDILISTDFVDEPMNATWDTLTSLANLSTGSFAEVSSGDIDITDYLSDNVTIAFHYTGGTKSGTTATIQIDDIVIEGTEHSVATNLEPEYIAISDDSKYAYVTCQENNAMAIVDLDMLSITDIIPLGFKDHSIAGNGLDASDKDDEINITTHPVLGMYMPDAITYVTIDGQGYVLSANEGDARDYDAFAEEERVEDLELDEDIFGNLDSLQDEKVLGRLTVTSTMGDTDNDGKYEELYVFGTRSFSIWNATTGLLVWDSGDDFEQKTALAYPDDFNSNNDENETFESRSDNKGPEPEAITIAELNGNLYALIGLERMGGVMIYNINNPSMPVFESYSNNRDFTVDDVETNAVGDLGVECISFINNTVSPDGKNYVVTANEVSGTVSVFEIDLPTSISKINNTQFSLYPNPSTGSSIEFTVKDTYTLTDLNGKIINVFSNTQHADVSNLSSGTYLVKNSNMQVAIFVKK